MKKILLLIGIIVISLFCTACINDFAIHELNVAGMKYLDKGEYEEAIARFKSCVELDSEVFESRYNLGIALLSNKNFKEAISELEYAKKLNPIADVYYSIGAAYEGEGLKIEEDNKYSKEEIIEHLNFIVQAISEFREYIKLSKNNEENDSIEKHITGLKNSIIEIAKENELNPLDFSITEVDLSNYDNISNSARE